MEALGVAANVIAVVDLSAKLVGWCAQYAVDVKNANNDKARLIREITALNYVSQEAKDFLEGPRGTKLKTSTKLLHAIVDGELQLQRLEQKLAIGVSHATKEPDIPAWRWPFQGKDVERTIQELTRCNQAISLALQVDQTALILDFDQKTVLDRLPVAEGASFDSHAEEHNPTCLANTRVELLDVISKWVGDPSAKAIFWLNGMAGTGKSTISRTIARSLSGTGHLGASFFFKRGEADRGGLSKLFTTIASQLVVRASSLALLVKDAIEVDPRILKTAVREQFNKLIIGPLSKMQQAASGDAPLVIIVDALDECEKDADIKLVIELFSSEQVQSSRLKIFVTSRPELPIRLGFSSVEGTYRDFILHEIPPLVIEHDISAFLEHELAKIRHDYNASVPEERNLPLIWPGQSNIQALVKMAVPLFIFAATACRFISDRRCGSPDEQLTEVLLYQTRSQESQLDATYLPVLNKFVAGLPSRKRDQLLQQFREIVGSIAILASPLSAFALGKLLNISVHTIDSQLDSLHSVLSIPSSAKAPVRLLHLSFRDFLVDPEKRGKNPFWIDEKQAHMGIATNCLRILAFLRRDLCGIKAPGMPRSSIESQKIDACLPPTVQYACLYWVYHVQQARIHLDDGGPVHEFLISYFLYWMEALSYIGRISESLGLIKTLQSLLQPENSKQTSEFLNDATRFILANISVVDSTPLQLYSSLLVFAPERSKVRTIFKAEIAPWISLEPKVDSDWSQCLQTLEGHSDGVNSVAFSHDSALIVSSSGDRTIRVWRADTGECVQTLEGHSGWVSSVAFSHDSALIASGSYNRTVRVWRADTGECIQTLEGHTDWVSSVAFSHDSALIASGSHNRTVRVWRADTGECIQTLEGHTDWVSSMAFSHDSALIVSSSGDRTIRVWRVNTGECVQTLEGHSGEVSSVAFSHDSALIASGSADRTVRVWRADTGECVQTLEGHTDWVISVVFSHDSALIASSSHDATVQVWRADTGESMQNTDIGVASYHLSFEPGNKYLLTDAGAIALRTITAIDPSSIQSRSKAVPAGYSGFGISQDHCWITWNGQNLLWLPMEFRPSCSVVSRSTVVVGSDIGRVMVVQFSLHELPEVL